MSGPFAIVAMTRKGVVSILKDLDRQLCVDTYRALSPDSNPWPDRARSEAASRLRLSSWLTHSRRGPYDLEQVDIVGAEIPEAELWPKPADFEDQVKFEIGALKWERQIEGAS